MIEVRSSWQKGGNKTVSRIARVEKQRERERVRERERERERERKRTDNIRNVAQQRFARCSLCFGYFCTLRVMKVRLRSFRDSLLAINAVASRYVSDPLRTHFPVLRNAM